MKKLFPVLLFAGLMSLPFAAVADHHETATPKSVIHIVTVAWKTDTKPEQIQAALDGVKALPAQFKGITRVWTKALKVQNPQGATIKKTHVIVMEFADEAALTAYTDSPAQKEWYKVYTPIRETSTTFDVTN
ncbi:MAG TPA: Dabb family protein [Opitutaceae bacterium]|nr:Dabb family protein [Opitutaceae bacterium]